MPSLNIFNIVAIIAILVIAYFLYKKFTAKVVRRPLQEPLVAPSAPPPSSEDAESDVPTTENE
jgi:hypothetical protein